MTEAMGYREDAPVSLGRDIRRNENVVWFPDSKTLTTILPHLPPTMDGGRPVKGLNARFRCYRYIDGDLFKPHYDGSWPGSQIDPETGQVVHDAFGERWSTMTAVIYLNDDFQGGETRFFVPVDSTEGGGGGSPVSLRKSAGQPPLVVLKTVEPVEGSVLCFEHGDMALSPLHEGALVTSPLNKAKYVIRTDVLYSTQRNTNL
jgi:hypothetical protein